jgi:hypothetical protein
MLKEGMTKNLDASTKTLGVFCCFILIAYIFYFLGSLSSHVSRNIYLSAPCDRLCCRRAEDPAPEKEKDMESETEITLMAKRELELRRILEETKELERRMRSDMAEWSEERKREMKGWREEQIRWLWDRKKQGESGVLGWFRVRRKK